MGYDGSTIMIPAISIGNGQSFSAEIAIATGKVLRLRVVGQASGAGGAVWRSVSIEAELDPRYTFGYGMFAKGPIFIEQNLQYLGANDPDEATMFSAAGGVAITVDSGHIDGDVLTQQPGATVDIGATIGGDILPEADVFEPAIDGSVFEPFATNIVDSSTDFSSGTFTNIRIRGGTNPAFGNDVTIQGVMYIEAPNNVSFTGNVTIVGVIVSEDPGAGASPSEHYVYFKNNLSTQGLDELPETFEFATLREMVGSAFLLPGFTLDFKNNFSSINGAIVAEQIITKNNLDGIVYGNIIALGDAGVTFKNNAAVTIDRSKYPGLAPGTVPGAPPKLVLRPSSYTEH